MWNEIYEQVSYISYIEWFHGRSFMLTLLPFYQLNLDRKRLLTFLNVPFGTSFLMRKYIYLISTLSFMTLLIQQTFNLSIVIVYLVFYVILMTLLI